MMRQLGGLRAAGIAGRNKAGNGKLVARSMANMIGAIAAGMLAISIMSMVTLIAKENRDQALEEFGERAVSVSAVVANASQNILLARDTSTLSHILETMKREPDFRHAFIADDFSLVASVGRNTDQRVAFSQIAVEKMLGDEPFKLSGQDGVIQSVQSDTLLVLSAIRVAFNNKHIGYVAAAFDRSRVLAESGQRMATTLLAGLLVSMMLSAGLFMLLIRAMRPLKGVERAITAISAGNLAIEIPGLGRKDEVGAIGRALLVLRDGLMDRQKMQADKDKSQREQAARQQAMEGVIHSFRGEIADSLGTFAGTATQLSAAASQLVERSRHADLSAQNAASSATEISTSVTEATAASEQLATTIHAVESRVTQMREGIMQAAEASRSNSDAIRQLEAHARDIGEVVNLIRNIAAQTNLLALNATIEAARAGDAGRGFAVVAQEVKSLAAQTADATDRVVQQVEAIQRATQTVVISIDGVAEQMRGTETYTAEVANAVVEQASATTEIARSVAASNSGTQAIASDLTQLADMVSEASRAGASVQQAVESMQAEAARLRASIDIFLSRVAA